MKIICIVGSFSFGGAERVMTNLVNSFSKKNEVTYVAIQARKDIAYPICTNVKVINGLGYKNKLEAVKLLREVIKREAPDVVLSFLIQINIITLIATMGLNIPVVISERNDPSQEKILWKRCLRDLLYPHCTGIVFQTKGAQSFFPDKVQRKSTIISNPIFISMENSSYTAQNRKKEIVAVGRLEKQKNHSLLIEAFVNVVKRHPDYSLCIYGEGSLRQVLEKLISDRGLTGKIKMPGNKADIHDRIKDSALFVMTSDFEGMPNALMEAMALGLCCISSDCPSGGPRELIKDGKNGYLFKVGDQTDLEQKMLYALENPDISEQVGYEAKKVLDSHNLKVIALAWEKYLHEVCML